MTALPPGWHRVRLGDVVQPARAGVDPADHPELPYLGLEHVEAHSTRIIDTSPSSSVRSTSFRFAQGSTLYARLRPYLNKVCTPDFEGIGSGEFIVFPPSRNLARGFLKYLLNQPAFVEFTSTLDTGDRPRVSWDGIREFALCLPPRAEQERIVSAIEEQFSRLDAGVGALERGRHNLRRMRAATVLAAVTGRLVPQDMREGSGSDLLADIRANAVASGPRQTGKARHRGLTTRLPPLPASWATAPWSAIGRSQNGRAFPSGDYSASGTRLLRPGNLHESGRVVWTEANTRHLPSHFSEDFPDHLVGPGEIVVNLTAQSLRDEFLGRVCMTEDGAPVLLNQRIARLTPCGMNPRFVFWVLKSQIFRRFVDQLNTGSLIQHMFTSQLDEFVLPVPPLAEQGRIVGALEAHMAVLAAVEDAVRMAEHKVIPLRSSILTAAFSGKLVPQDPTDEPASILLDRIAAQRASMDGHRAARNARQERLPL